MPELHRERMGAAIERDGDGQRALLAGDEEGARTAFRAASELYRESWEVAPPRSYGRLVGLLKSAILAGRGHEAAYYVRSALADEDVASPPAAYAQALAALIAGDDEAVRAWAARMRGGSGAFGRTADALEALAARDPVAYAAALEAIVRDFEQRADHLTAVAIADTAVMLERLAATRGLPAAVQSALLPPRADGPRADDRVRVLADGNRMPRLGLGVWQVPDGPECVNAVRCALDLGYRHIDTAQGYGNEASVGRGLRESGVSPEDVFLTTKFDPNLSDPEAEAERSLRRLGVDRVDLYIVHWPQGGPTWAWPGMERAQERGYTRSIGVSNFNVGELEEVMAIAARPPVVNQVQFSPFEYRRRLLEASARRNVAIEAYSPLGTGSHISDPAVAQIAQRVGRSPAQVLLRWSLQRDTVVIPKSTHRERIEENAQSFDFEISDPDMAALDGLDRTGATDQAREQKWW